MTLLERDDELNLLASALGRAEQAKGSLVLIGGPLGSGRSALLRSVRHLPGAATATVLQASASVLEQNYAFGVVRQLLEPALAGVTDDHQRDRWLAGAAGLARPVFSPRHTDLLTAAKTVSVQRAVILGLGALVEHMSDDGPVVVLIDDLQWVDEPSLRWLAHLVSRLSELPVLVVVTERQGDPRAAGWLVTQVSGAAAHTLQPNPLSLSGTRAFIVQEMGEAAQEEFVAACHDTTYGNPLFLKAVSLNLRKDGISPLDTHADLVRTRRPPLLRQVLIDCFHQYGDAVRDCASAMSVLENTDAIEVISRVAGVEPEQCSDAVVIMQRLGVLVRRGTSKTLHPMVRDVVEDTLSAEQRERLHLKAAEALERGGFPAESVAAQLMAVTVPTGTRAIGTLRAAADTALARGAPDTASRYLRRALLDASPAGEDRARLLVELAGIANATDVGAAIRYISSAVPLLRSARERAVAVVRIATPAIADAPPAIRGLISQVASDLGDPDELIGEDHQLGLQLEARVRSLGRADALRQPDPLRRLDELGPNPSVDTPAERELLIVLLYALMVSARKSAAEIGRLGALVLEREEPNPSHVHMAMPLLVWTLAAAESAEVSSWLDRAVLRAQQENAVLELALIRTEQATVGLWTGRFRDAKVAAVEAYELAALDWETAGSSAAMVFAGVAIATGDTSLLRGIPMVHSPDPVADAGLAGLHRMFRAAVAAATATDQRGALEHYLESGRQLERSNWRNPVLFPWRAEAIQLHQAVGELNAARALAEENFELAVEWGTPAVIGQAQRIIGGLCEGAEGVTKLREAVATLESSLNRSELAHALLALANRLRANGDSAEAAYHLRRCRQLAIDSGDYRVASQLGVRLPSEIASAEERPVFSTAESKVAGLAAAGLGNQQIADQLGVGIRAVQKHLTNVYRKFGLRGRGELGEMLRQETPDVPRISSNSRPDV
ncbi:AAA family ATPase [Amycolatopsis sp. H20-H5]|uniref:AAA family ATPase n=1 Tax=Amycolatopsis sp. H20-H5 TaxID=3046309 RepID=UPI002DBDE67E|nr:AAA family ATPase [Amycolatopsis sp. H20-H5]MEC3975557.1 AAA family ATPase [Amycolatopsis sp. H20-H5]